MELAKSTETVEKPYNGRISSVGRLDHSSGESSTVDPDLVRAWELKAELRWVRKDHGRFNGFRWLVWDRYGLGHPPSNVQKRTSVDSPTVLTRDAASQASILRLVKCEGASSRIESPDASVGSSILQGS
jgi:hypothetical protein